MAADVDNLIHRQELMGEKLVLRHEVSIPADVSAISPVVDGLMKLIRELQWARDKEFAVETALREALANAIIHGCKKDASKRVQCCVTCDQSRGILIIVRDPGKGFDSAALPAPTSEQNLYSQHGRGIYLINLMMDEVHYERGGSEIHMRKY